MIPDGYFIDGLLFWGDALAEKTTVSKGFFLDVESPQSLSVNALNELHEQINRMLSCLEDGYAMQLQWYVDSDYDDVLAHYRGTTQALAHNPWSALVREGLDRRFKAKKKHNLLRKEKLALFVSKTTNANMKSVLNGESHMQAFFKTIDRELMAKVEAIGANMPFVRFSPMTDTDHFVFFERFFNPSLKDAKINAHKFTPEESILENCLNSDGVCTQFNGQVVFKMDDNYHALIVIRRWPKTTHPLMMQVLTQAVSQNYSITQTIYPLNESIEIEHEEKMVEDLRKNVGATGKSSLYATIERKEEKINALMNGYTKPYHVLTIMRVWDRSPDALYEKTLALKTAINGMGGMSFHQANQEAQLLGLFFETFPGWTGGSRRAWDMYAENHFLADLVPFSSTFCGSERPEAIYEGVEQNIVGVECFRNGTPQHAVLLGMTGAGKSVAMFDLLSQTECFYDFTAIIEEGLSYGTYTKIMGSTPIIIHPDSKLTINYLDTNRLPLTEEHVAMAASMCLKMVGMSQDEDKNNKRLAIFTEYISHHYWGIFEQWASYHRSQYEEVRRLAFAVYEAVEKPGSKLNLTDAYFHFKEMGETAPDELKAILMAPSSDALLEFEKNHATRTVMRNIAYAYFGPNDCPTHSSLVEFLKSDRFDHHNSEEVDNLTTMLGTWTRDHGAYGRLFDGPSNLTITDKIAHFELGSISDAMPAMKELAGFVVANWIRQHIMKMPRSKKKRIIFEEVSRFLNIKGGDRILGEAYAQLRKYGCWVCCVTQQYSQLKDSPLRPVIFGNSKLFFLMKQNDRQDLHEIAAAINLPERAVEAIHKYELPEHQTGSEKASYMMVYALGGKFNSCGTVKIVASPELLYAASSNGEVFDQRMKHLDKHSNIVEGIIYESNKATA